MTTASVTSLLDTLESRGLVERRPDPSDRRKVLVALTGEGRAVTDRFLPEVVALQTAVMGSIGEAERARLMRTLARVQAGIRDLDPDAVLATTPKRRKPARGRPRAG